MVCDQLSCGKLQLRSIDGTPRHVDENIAVFGSGKVTVIEILTYAGAAKRTFVDAVPYIVLKSNGRQTVGKRSAQLQARAAFHSSG